MIFGVFFDIISYGVFKLYDSDLVPTINLIYHSLRLLDHCKSFEQI